MADSRSLPNPGSTVEHRHFKGRHEMLDAVIGRVNDVLTGIVTRAARLSLSLYPKLPDRISELGRV